MTNDDPRHDTPGVAMTNPLPTQEQREALRALGIDDEVIELCTPEDREKFIRNLTPELVRKALEVPTARNPQQPPQARETNNANQPPSESHNKVIHLAERAQEVIEITELEPNDGTYIGKRINLDGSITPYPRFLKYWRQSVKCVPANIPQLFIYQREARTRNIALIPGAPANLERQPTLRQKAGVFEGNDRGDHGFVDKPTRLIVIDLDDVPIAWRAEPEGALRTIVEQMGEAWASASFTWFFSASHGLELDEHKRWTGRIVDGHVSARLAFIAERPMSEQERVALIDITKVRVPEIDRSIGFTVSLNYIQRPLWIEHPDRDVLGDIPTIGWVKGTHDRLAIPDNLPHTARWAQAQGLGSDIADHPDAESAVRAIGSDHDVRSHVKAAVIHLLRANPIPDVVSFYDHSINIIAKLRNMIAQHREEITDNLIRNGRSGHVVDELLQHTKTSWPLWCLHHPRVLTSKTIKLVKEAQQADATTTREAAFARVADVVAQARTLASASQIFQPRPPVMLLVAPVGSGKSTAVRAAAVRYVTERPKKTVVILTPRHKLNDEQIEWLRKEHPEGNYTPTIWRGRHADNPHNPDPEHPGKFLPMCVRSEEVKEVEKRMLDVEHTCCKRGRGEKAIKCPFYDTCAFQQQKQIKANIIFAAHECAVHEMPKVFGDVGWVIFDESPLDAFMFGVDGNDRVEIRLDTLHTPLAIDSAKLGSYLYGTNYSRLMHAREDLYCALDKLRVPIDPHRGIAVPRRDLNLFTGPWSDDDDMGYDPKKMRSLTFRGKVDRHPTGHVEGASKNQAGRRGGQQHDQAGSQIMGAGRCDWQARALRAHTSPSRRGRADHSHDRIGKARRGLGGSDLDLRRHRRRRVAQGGLAAARGARPAWMGTAVAASECKNDPVCPPRVLEMGDSGRG